MKRHIIRTFLVLLCAITLYSCGSRRANRDPRLDITLEDVRPGMTLKDIMESPIIRADVYDTEFEMLKDNVLIDRIIFRKDTWSNGGVIGIYWTKLIFRNGVLVQKTSRFEALPRAIETREITPGTVKMPQ